MFPSGIQTAAVMLVRRRSPHLEQSNGSAKIILLNENRPLSYSFQSPSSMSAAGAGKQEGGGAGFALHYPLQALFKRVVMGGRGGTPRVSLVTACIICWGRSLAATEGNPDLHVVNTLLLTQNCTAVSFEVFSTIKET